jgi:T5SS/PEP-CTERM-associated repeat protein
MPKHASRARALLLAALMLPASEGLAAVTEWKIDGNGSYSNVNNWTNGAPTAADFVVFRRGDGVAYTVTLLGNLIGGFNSYQANFLRVGSNTVSFTQGINAGLTVTSTNTTAGGNPGVIIGEFPGETATVNSNISFAGNSVTLGNSPGSLGTVNINSGGWVLSTTNPSQGLLIGRSGSGVMNLTGSGKISILQGGIAVAGTSSMLSLSGPNTSVTMGYQLSIGGGNGRLLISNGATFVKQVSSSIDVGHVEGTVGMIAVEGAGSTFTAAGASSLVTLGGFGQGTLSVSGGGQMTIGGDLRAAANGQANVVVDGPGSLLAVGGSIIMNSPYTATPLGSATITLSNGGTLMVGGNIYNTTQSATSRLILDGGVLDLQNHAINRPIEVPSHAMTDVQFLSGVLKNVGALNRMSSLRKTSSGSLTLPTANSFDNGVMVSGGVLIVAHPDALGDPSNSSLTVENNAMARFMPNLATAVRTNIGISGTANNWHGRIDIANNAILLHIPVDSRAYYEQLMLNQVATAKAGGAWTGMGITSSALTADTSVAIADNGVLGFTSYRGKPVDSNTTIVTVALLGDATLDNHVDAFDLNRLAANWQQSSRIWSDGEFTHDGTVDAFDLNQLAAHWQSGLAGSFEAALAAYPQFEGVTVSTPEPAGVAILLPAFAGLVVRRRGVGRGHPGSAAASLVRGRLSSARGSRTTHPALAPFASAAEKLRAIPITAA